MKNLPTEYLSLLEKYISFKTISTDKRYQSQMNGCVSWLASLLKENKFSIEYLKHRNANPIIVAKYNINKKAETIMVYGHYDVQPASKTNWKSDPFDLHQTSSKLIARGIVDNKGQLMIHLYTILELIKENKLKYNIIFLIEGDEESGNQHLESILKKNKRKLSCDHIILSDGEMTGDCPTIDATFRGGVNLQIDLETAKSDLHSGIFGGAVPNAAHELNNLISKIFDKNNKIKIPGFYKDIEKATPECIKQNKSIENLKQLTKNATVKKIICEKGCDFYTQTGMRPTIQITGIESGYTHSGFANIIPSHASLKMNIRIVPNQNPKEVVEGVKNFIKQNTPDYVKTKITSSSTWPAIKLEHDLKMLEHISNILEKTHKKQTISRYVGGSLPIIGIFKEVLGVNPFSVSLANEDCNMHGVNENFKIKDIKKGLKFSREFFGK